MNVCQSHGLLVLLHEFIEQFVQILTVKFSTGILFVHIQKSIILRSSMI